MRQAVVIVALCGVLSAQDADAQRHLDRAEALVREEKFADARRAFEQAQALLASAGDTAASTALHARIAECHVAEGRFREAAEAWRRGGDHLDTVKRLVELASPLLARGRKADALPLLTEAVEMRRRLGAAEDHETADVLNALAHCLEGVGRGREALPRYAEALEILRRLFPGDHPDVALLLNNYAYCLAFEGRAAEALPLHEEAVGMARRLGEGDDDTLATYLNNLGICHWRLGRLEESLDAYRESLEMRRRLFRGDHAGVARSLNNLAVCLRDLGRGDEALPSAAESLEMRRRLFPPDHPDVAQGIDNLAAILGSLGRSAEALRFAEDALAMRRRLFPGDHSEVAQSLHSVALRLEAAGRPDEAISLYGESLEMYRRIFKDDHLAVAHGLGDLALCTKSLGRAADALPLYEESLRMYRRILDGDSMAVATALNNLARCLHTLGRAADALPLQEESLAMRRRVFRGDHPHVADGLNNLALCLDTLGRTAEALPRYEESLAMRWRLFPGDHPAVAQGLHNAGFCLCDLGRADEGLRMLGDAVAMSRRLGSSDKHYWLSSLGGCLLRLGRTAEAADALREAVEQVEDLRSGATGLTEEDRAAYYGALKEFHAYERLLHALVKLGRDEEALTYLERARSRSLLDTLERGRLDPLAEARRHAEERRDAALLDRIGAVEASLAAADAEVALQTHALARTGGDEARTRLAEARRAREEALRRRAQLIRGELAAARPADAASIRRLAGADSAVLVYAVSEREAALFHVPPRGAAIRAYRLTWPDGALVTAESLATKVAAYTAAVQRSAGDARGLEREGAPGAAGAALGRELFEALLPAGARETVLAAKLVYVAPAGALHRLPFETLVTAPGTFWLESGPPLAYGASGSALLWSRARRDEQLAEARLPEAVVVGDPLFRPPVEPPEAGVFVTAVPPDGQAARRGVEAGDVILAYDGREVRDPGTLGEALRAVKTGVDEGKRAITLLVWRAGESREIPVEAGRLGVEISPDAPPDAWRRFRQGDPALARAALERTADLSRYGELRPLPGTRREADAIAAALGDLRVTRLLGERATHPAVLEAAGRARYLHFATHGLADETETTSHSSLALTLPATPTPEDDGFLSLEDLLATWRGKLRMCELVVLSACETQRGRLQKDEAVQALPVGFLYAGAPTVIASLWRVDDASAAELMGDFYARLAQGKGKLEAFTEARKALRKSRPEPAHWAPFVFIGDPR